MHATEKPKLSREKSAEIAKEARERIEQSHEHDRENREEALKDLKFLSGDQWPDEVRRERIADGRPMLTINKMPQFLRQITNTIRQSDLSIKVAPVDSTSDPTLADIYNGLLRQIQYQSSAKSVYAMSAEHQSACGVGWFRVVSRYCDDDSFDQEICVKPIDNPLSVYDDPAARDVDRSDAMWRVITEIVPIETFKGRYPWASIEEVPTLSERESSAFFWSTAEDVRIAEYWRKVPVKRTLAMLADGAVVDITEFDKTLLPVLNITKQRQVDGYEIEQYIVNGVEVLEGPVKWPGKYIPIVPVIGAEIPINGKQYRHGVVRFAREPQQLYNYNRTAAAESMALAPKAPYLVTAEMIGPYKGQWDTANSKSRAYLLYKPDPNAPNARPMREHPPEMPSAYVQEASIASDDMKAVTGIYDASLGARSNEQSGIAIGRRQVQGDTANYHYQDNFQRALEYAGRVIVDLIPKIYDNERIIRILGDDDTEDYVPINAEIMSDMGQPVLMNDLSAAKFDIRVTIAPSQATKRMETANSLFEFAKAFPDAAPLIADLVAKNSDWPGSDEIAKRLRNMVPEAAMVDPEDPSTQPPDPMADPMVAAQMQEAAGKAQKAVADARKTSAEADRIEAENRIMGIQPMPEQPIQGAPQGMPPEMEEFPPGMMPPGAPVEPAAYQPF